MRPCAWQPSKRCGAERRGKEGWAECRERAWPAQRMSNCMGTNVNGKGMSQWLVWLPRAPSTGPALPSAKLGHQRSIPACRPRIPTVLSAPLPSLLPQNPAAPSLAFSLSFPQPPPAIPQPHMLTCLGTSLELSSPPHVLSSPMDILVPPTTHRHCLSVSGWPRVAFTLRLGQALKFLFTCILPS